MKFLKRRTSKMGYNLIPKNKEIKSISIGAFHWPFVLQETGMGYVLGYGAGRAPGTYVYSSGNNGSPVSNDNYKVSSKEAKAMAMVGRGFLSVQKFVNKEWTDFFPDDEERKKQTETKGFNGSLLYRQEMGKKTLELIEKVVEFIEKSNGFTIQ